MAELAEARHGGVDALGARREEDLRDQRDAGEERAPVRRREAIRQERLAAAAEADDAAGAGVGDEEPGRGGVREASEPRLDRGPDAGKRRRADARHGVRHLDHHAVRLLEVIDEVGLERAPPGAHLLAEVAGHGDGGMDAQVPPEGPVPDAAARQDARGVHRTGGDDDERRAHAQPAADRVVVAVEEGRLDTGGATALEHDAIGPAARVEPRAGSGGRRQVGQMHRLLRIARAAEGALPAAVAAVDVAPDRLAVETERLDAPVEELGVAADDLPRHGADRDGPLDLVEVGRHRERVGAFDALLGLPGAQHPVGCAEAGARVDHRGAADALPEGQRDGRTPECQGRAAAAVEALHALHRRPVEVGLREIGALLEHDHAKAAACELVRHDGAASTRADDADVGRLLDRPLDVRILERCQARAATWQVRVEAVVRVPERRLDAWIGGEGGEHEHLEEREGDTPPRRAAHRAGLDPSGARSRRKPAEGAEMTGGEGTRLPGAEEDAELPACARG